MPGQPDIEKAAAHRAVLADNLRYENARWWRNLNRCMTPVGLSIIIIVVCSLKISPYIYEPFTNIHNRSHYPFLDHETPYDT